MPIPLGTLVLMNLNRLEPSLRVDTLPGWPAMHGTAHVQQVEEIEAGFNTVPPSHTLLAPPSIHSQTTCRMLSRTLWSRAPTLQLLLLFTICFPWVLFAPSHTCHRSSCTCTGGSQGTGTLCVPCPDACSMLTTHLDKCCLHLGTAEDYLHWPALGAFMHSSCSSCHPCVACILTST
jgi:hypothetical protein